MNTMSDKMWDAFEEGAFPNIEGEKRQDKPTPAPLTLNDYQRRAFDNCALSKNTNNWSYISLGLVAEVGEICDKVAKSVRRGEAVVNDNSLVFQDKDIMQGVLNEMGDVLWFVACMAQYFGVSLEDVARANIDKITKRRLAGEIITHKDH